MAELFLETVKELPLTETINLNLLSYKGNAFPSTEALKRFRFKDHIGCTSTYILYGDEGSGKSGVLMQASMWAHKSGWIVATVPSAYDWTQKGMTIKRHHDTGLYLQQQSAKEFLEQFC